MIEGKSSEYLGTLSLTRPFEITASMIGANRLARLVEEDHGVMEHGFGVGELMFQMLDYSAARQEVCELGALFGSFARCRQIASRHLATYKFCGSIYCCTATVGERCTHAGRCH